MTAAGWVLLAAAMTAYPLVVLVALVVLLVRPALAEARAITDGGARAGQAVDELAAVRAGRHEAPGGRR